jgi:prephenate dehydrogenase
MPHEEKTGDDPRASFATVCIVGLGLVGGSLALALRRAGFAGRITGVSGSGNLTEARRLGAIDEGFPYDRLLEAASGADLVVLSSPISAILKHLERLGSPDAALRPGAIVTDVGSTKRVIASAAERVLPRGTTFIGGHPLAGSERSGMSAADPFLFQNAYYVLTPGAGTRTESVERLGAFLGLTGARVMVLSAEEHDRIAAAISHLPQILAVGLVRSLDTLGPLREQAIRLAAGGFRDMTRIASSPFAMWRDIVETNRDAMGDAMGSFLDGIRSGIGRLETKALEVAFDGAARTRAEIPRDTKGFLHELCDVLVLVEDRPGMIAGIALPLATAGINIKDIEVLKVREGEAGTLRLAFESEREALRAIEVLTHHGFGARKRE